jgi:quinol monooxygenase YgiN
MYGTVARLKLKPGHLEAFKAELEDREWPEGAVAWYVYQTDDDLNQLFLAVVFEDKASYLANADRPETHQEYLKMLEHLEAEPEWHDGEIVHSRS